MKTHQRIVVSKISLGNESFEPPAGLSDLLEKAWGFPDETDAADDNLLSDYIRTVYKNKEGRWVTCYEKVGETS